MKCENCNEKNATFFFERSINGEKYTYRLCRTCAEELGLITKGKIAIEESFSPLFSSHSHTIDEIFGLPTGGGVKTKKCEGCGATWQEISKSGKAGCALCYGTFATDLERSIRSIHGNVTHVGHRPTNRRAPTKRDTLVTDLKKALRVAIESENFEEAARLRDEIRAQDKKGE